MSTETMETASIVMEKDLVDQDLVAASRILEIVITWTSKSQKYFRS